MVAETQRYSRLCTLCEKKTNCTHSVEASIKDGTNPLMKRNPRYLEILHWTLRKSVFSTLGLGILALLCILRVIGPFRNLPTKTNRK